MPTLSKDGGVSFVDDKEGKPVGIMRHIGQRPIFAAGNSDGDFAMLEWTTAGEGPRFGMLVHHTDAAREFAYDREGHIGVLSQGLDEAPAPRLARRRHGRGLVPNLALSDGAPPLDCASGQHPPQPPPAEDVQVVVRHLLHARRGRRWRSVR